MTKARTVGRRGPAVRAIDPWVFSTGKMHQLLSDEERARLAVIASIVRFKKGAEIYREGYRVDAIFNIISGVVKAYRKGPVAASTSPRSCFLTIYWGCQSQSGKFLSSMNRM